MIVLCYQQVTVQWELYSIYHLLGILNHEDIKNHKVFESKTPSHPEIDKLAYIDASTVPLGQGIAILLVWHEVWDT
ncbi:hypothetical protein [Mycoplasmopsis cynos]|uniref:hypothetical protein n=1 Tax=Mycoplasmopsis cynos TaxID=171284 RepID=UPI0024C550EE|nr:hypothetical protein [Mycoplasmopsis cynos]WAM04603.1 hypothetical protein ONA01_06495 [Mycoplasmopsis cynos]